MEKYSSLRARPRMDLVEHAPLPFPLTLFVEPTNICNFKCKFCPQSLTDFEETTGGWHQLSLAQFSRVADGILELAPCGVRSLNFYLMGEPLANRETPAMMKLARDRGLADVISVTTNGTLLKGATAEAVLDAAPDYVRVSVYGPDHERHSAVTGSRVPLDRIVENLAGFRQLRGERSTPHLYVKMIDQGDELNQAFLGAFSGVADEVAIEPVMNWNDPQEGLFTGKDTEELLAHPYFAARKEVCPSPFYTLIVHADLQVSVCCVDWAKQAVVGNLKHQSLREVWRGNELRDFQMAHLRRERHALEACRNCTYIHVFPDNIDQLEADAFAERGTSR